METICSEQSFSKICINVLMEGSIFLSGYLSMVVRVSWESRVICGPLNRFYGIAFDLNGPFQFLAVAKGAFYLSLHRFRFIL